MATLPRNASSSTAAAHSKNSKSSKSKITVPGNDGVKFVHSCTIRKPAEELFSFWRNFENLTKVSKYPIQIRRTSDTDSHWSATSPLSKVPIEWDATIINERPAQLIAWRSMDGADVANAGSVRFEAAPGDEGTEVTVALEYNAPGGKLGALLAKLTGEEAGQQVAETLRRFKALMEAGEIPTIEGQSVGEPQRSAKKKGKK